MFFVYCNSKMTLKNIVSRIEFLRNNKLMPYLMRDINCWSSELNDFYIDLAAWCNQPRIFKKMDFYTFLQRRHILNKERVVSSYSLYSEGKKNE